MSDIKIQAARNEQSESDKKSTLDKLKSKKRRQQKISIEVNGEKLELLFQAVSYAELDAIQSKHQPTQQQRIEGAVFNRNTFPPALIAACSVDPKMTEQDALDLWNSDDWSTGELQSIFEAVSNLCMKGLDIPFTAAD